MQSILSFASSLIEPSSNQQQQQQMDASIPVAMMTTATTHRHARASIRQAPTTSFSTTTTTATPTTQRSPPELGGGLAAILRSFLEYIPPHIQVQQAANPNPFRLFCTEAPITLEAFGQRLGTYFACSPVCFQVAAIYLGKVWAVHPEIFEALSAFKLMLVALTVAVKFCEDRCSSQVHYARCGGIEVSELNFLEALFLNSLLKFEAFVQEAEIQIAAMTLEKYCVAAEQSAAAANSPSIVDQQQESSNNKMMCTIPEDSMMDTTTAEEMGTAAPVAASKTSSLRRTSHTSF